MSKENWFHILSATSGKIISAPSVGDFLRSQVIVCPPTLSDHGLWCWKEEFLYNKASGMVLDIRKGRLRLIEDTEICLYNRKPLETASNQRWGVKETEADSFDKTVTGVSIYSRFSDEWVLDVQSMEDGDQKLVLVPSQPIGNENQRWTFVPEGKLDISAFEAIKKASENTSAYTYTSSNDAMITPPSSVSSPELSSKVETDFPKGLSPAKRVSHSSNFGT